MEEIIEDSEIKATLTATPDEPAVDFNDWIKYIYDLIKQK
jgi:hypothetical protein